MCVCADNYYLLSTALFAFQRYGRKLRWGRRGWGAGGGVGGGGAVVCDLLWGISFSKTV